MTADTRYYVVENGDNPERLIEAVSKAGAERHVARPITARLATQRDLVRLRDTVIEKAGEATAQE